MGKGGVRGAVQGEGVESFAGSTRNKQSSQTTQQPEGAVGNRADRMSVGWGLRPWGSAPNNACCFLCIDFAQFHWHLYGISLKQINYG